MDDLEQSPMVKCPLRLAMFAPYPASAVLPENWIVKKYRSAEHAASWIQNLCRELATRDDLQIRVYVHTRAVRRRYEMRQERLEFVFLPKVEPARFDPFYLYIPARWTIRREIRTYQPDVIHAHGTEGWCGLLAVEQPVPSIISIQGIMAALSEHLGGAALRRWISISLEEKAIRRARALIAKTIFAETWARSLNSTCLIRRIPNALNPAFLNVRPTYQQSLALCIGSLTHLKGVDLVLRAFARLSTPQARLAIIGDGPLRASLEKLASELGVRSRVEFTGRLEPAAIAEKMAAARVLMFGSRMDTAPNVVLEAHAAGLPVVATRAGGIPELVEHGRDGYLVPKDDPAAMAEATEQLLDWPEQCQRFGQAGREKVARLHNPQRIADLHVEYYRDVASSEPGKS
jgi:glycosyltransferase involved in cell wall biosynthesis